MTRPIHASAAAFALALAAALAAGSCHAQPEVEERLCASMARHLERLEASPRTRPEALAQARERYRQRCDAASQAAPAAAPTATAPPPQQPPAAPVTRTQTPGRFVDWNRALDADCRPTPPGGDGSGMATRCAQAKIDRALAERRLDQAEVDACLAPGPSADSGAATERAARPRDRAEARRAALGGPAYWAWEGPGGCRLVDRVRTTFAAPPEDATTTAATNTTTDAAAQARMCSLDPRLPFCRSAESLPLSPPGSRGEPYWRWQAQAYSQCGAQLAAGQPREHCARRIVEQALAERRAAPAAVDACRARWRAGARDEPEPMSVDQCLLAAALLEQAATSRVVDAAAARPSSAPPALNVQGLNRPELVAPLYAGDGARVSNDVENTSYALTSFGRLNEACPNLGLAGTAMQIAQAQVRRTQEAVARGVSGRGSAADAATTIAAANEMMKMLPDCERIVDDPPRREACRAERDSAFQVQRSPPALADASRLIERHGCAGPQMARYARQLADWLLAPPGGRGSLAGLERHPQAPALNRLFEQCRRQAGDGVADAWCGCYVRSFAGAPRGTRSAPADVLDAAARSAFVGGPLAWYAPPEIAECEPRRQAIDRWRRDQAIARPVVTACLVQQAPAEVLLQPDLQACRYRSAGGTIELRATQCAPRLLAQEWGSEPVACSP
ncbi:MAG: hypothetical protein LCI02_10295 [Proteobacteria bacterium]|nr:hypothetical protein [Pseudomonadota bacterium]